jgi:hypothetical protein
MVDHKVLPELDIRARSKVEIKNKRGKPRERTDPNERAFSSDDSGRSPYGDSGEMFSLMQNLMHGVPAVGAGAGAQVSGQQGAQGQVMMPPQGASAGIPIPPGMVSGSGGGVALPPNMLPIVGYDLNGAAGGQFALQPGMMVGNQKVELIAGDSLSSLLSELQSKLDLDNLKFGAGQHPAQAIDLNATIGDLLQQHNDENTLNAIDGVSSDVINLITLLYEAIWDDETIQIPIKELLGRTQITALKIALDDPEFFDREDHPARIFINELATAGISWTEFEKLEHDPMYKKMLEVVESLVDNYNGDMDYVIELVAGFRDFKRQLEMESQQVEERLKDVDARQERLDELKQYALQKITERVLDEELDPFVKSILEKPFHHFLVKLILKEGPGGVSWKPVMNTIDVLLWTVQREKADYERARFEKLRPRLTQNLKKAMLVAGMEAAKADAALKKLRQIQESCFLPAVAKEQPAPAAEEATAQPEVAADTEEVQIDAEVEQDAGLSIEPELAETAAAATEPAADKDADTSEEDMDEEVDILALLEAESKKDDLADDDEHVQMVNNIPIGIWMEFQVGGEQSIRCTLAAKISTIDKYVFVNSDGVKVVEKSRMGLAKELKAGSVKIISESPLVDRAMETVIGKLRDQPGEKAGEEKAKDGEKEEGGLSLEPK